MQRERASHEVVEDYRLGRNKWPPRHYGLKDVQHFADRTNTASSQHRHGIDCCHGFRNHFYAIFWAALLLGLTFDFHEVSVLAHGAPYLKLLQTAAYMKKLSC